ncbi:MAG TPA: hypothetical protein VIM16_20560 [Mucilaginibacter sp.]|jgi:hypothetical protein
MGTKKLTNTAAIQTSLVIFTCEGREHLLLKSFESFSKSCKDVFAHKILVIDGKISQAVIDLIAPDMVIQSRVRRGYVNSIVKALKNIDTDYFFWLEDDWEFPRSFSIDSLAPFLDEPDVLQVTLAKLSVDNDFKSYKTSDIYINGNGFSANPSLCRTAAVKDIFNEVVTYEKNEDSKFLSFEYFATDYSLRKELISLIKYHNGLAFVNHLGDLESTGREYHMINSIRIPVKSYKKEYISGLNRDQSPSLYNKIGLFVKLYIAVFYLSVKLFLSREAYDFAFRIYVASLKRFKH